jgi:hypothetical protein
MHLHTRSSVQLSILLKTIQDPKHNLKVCMCSSSSSNFFPPLLSFFFFASFHGAVEAPHSRHSFRAKQT